MNYLMQETQRIKKELKQIEENLLKTEQENFAMRTKLLEQMKMLREMKKKNSEIIIELDNILKK